MKKLYALLVVVLALEAMAFQVYRSHPLVRPPYFSALTLIIQLLMTWGGVESARWLLRASPASRAGGPFSDLTRLWVWCGPWGGMFLGLACLLGNQVAERSASHLAGFLVVAHFSGGALLWCVGAAWALPDLMTDEDSTLRDKLLAVLGFLTHALGFAAYVLVFPGERGLWNLPPWLCLVLSSLIFCYLTFYVYSCVLVWATIFPVWQPAGRDESALEEGHEGGLEPRR